MPTMDNSSYLDRIIAEAMKKPADQRLKELEALLENGKLTLPQIKLLQTELFDLRKRFKSKK